MFGFLLRLRLRSVGLWWLGASACLPAHRGHARYSARFSFLGCLEVPSNSKVAWSPPLESVWETQRQWNGVQSQTKTAARPQAAPAPLKIASEMPSSRGHEAKERGTLGAPPWGCGRPGPSKPGREVGGLNFCGCPRNTKAENPK